MGFLSSLVHVLTGFFQSLFQMFGTDIEYEMEWLGYHLLSFYSAWSASFASYGVFIPAVLVAAIGVTMAGLYLVFVFYRGATDLVGGA